MDERVLTYGDRAVDDTADAVLDDRALELGGPGGGRKKRPTKKKPSGVVVVIVAGGFPGYASEKDEIADMGANRWLPHTEDFKETAGPGFWEATNVSYFLGAINKQTKTIARVVFIGHGSPTGLGLSGKRDGSVTRFTEKLDADALDENQDTIRQLAAKLHPDATIDLVCCDVGLGQSFIKRMANSFGRCVRAFQGAVYWEHPLNETKTAIANRGRTSSDNRSFKKGYAHLAYSVTVCPEPSPQLAP